MNFKWLSKQDGKNAIHYQTQIHTIWIIYGDCESHSAFSKTEEKSCSNRFKWSFFFVKILTQKKLFEWKQHRNLCGRERKWILSGCCLRNWNRKKREIDIYSVLFFFLVQSRVNNFRAVSKIQWTLMGTSIRIFPRKLPVWNVFLRFHSVARRNVNNH